MSEVRQYIAIDLKSFYASVECVERGLDPLDACLVVADSSRTEKTICLAVSPALKQFGIGGRPRLFEVIQQVEYQNLKRGHRVGSTSWKELNSHPDYFIDYYVAPPRMAFYIEYSTRIYEIYLRYIAPEDIHVYSIDEVFIDATSYLSIYKMSAHELAMTMIRDVLKETGITATAGIGTNLYLCKIAMDILAKKMRPDKDGVRIAELDEKSYREQLWHHQPLTDFWRVGAGTARRLSPYGIQTMGDIARCSIENEEFLFKLFGVNAELLIDHAWGWEPVTMDYIKSYIPETRSVSSGQVLSEPYDCKRARVVVMEMADALAFDLIDKGVVTDQVTLQIGYDRESLINPKIRSGYQGRVVKDHYGRPVPEHAHGSCNAPYPTSSSMILSTMFEKLYDRIINPELLVRRVTLCANNLVSEKVALKHPKVVQLDLFTDYEEVHRQNEVISEELRKERKEREAILKIKKVFGKNAILRGLNFAEGATQKDRNKQIGGHHE